MTTLLLLRHAIHNTTPNITKTVLDKTGKEMKIRNRYVPDRQHYC